MHMTWGIGQYQFLKINVKSLIFTIISQTQTQTLQLLFKLLKKFSHYLPIFVKVSSLHENLKALSSLHTSNFSRNTIEQRS